MSPNYQGMIKPHHSRLAFLYRSIDFFALAIALWLSCYFLTIEWETHHSTLLCLSLGFYTLFSNQCDLYRPWRTMSLTVEFTNILAAWFSVLILLVLFILCLDAENLYPNKLIQLWVVFPPLLIFFWRFLLRLFLRFVRSHGYNTRSVALVGATVNSLNIIKSIESSPWMGFRIIGVFEDRSLKRLPKAYQNSPDLLGGSFQNLIDKAYREEIDHIYITLPMQAEKRIKSLINRLSDASVSIHFIPDFFVFDLLHAKWSSLGSLPCVSIHDGPCTGSDTWIKKAEDMILGVLILIIIFIPMLIIALLIKINSPGPIIYVQRRYGLNGESINVWKFRTMTTCDDDDGVVQATKNDERVTKLGKFLRQTSLDELPQFFNVLQGRMSIVGPRPHAVIHNEEYRKIIKGYMLRHKAQPGITGWAQINGFRGETNTLQDMENRVEHDLWYIRNWSLLLDLRIIVVTAFKVFTDKKAY